MANRPDHKHSIDTHFSITTMSEIFNDTPIKGFHRSDRIRRDFLTRLVPTEHRQQTNKRRNVRSGRADFHLINSAKRSWQSTKNEPSSTKWTGCRRDLSILIIDARPSVPKFPKSISIVRSRSLDFGKVEPASFLGLIVMSFVYCRCVIVAIRIGSKWLCLFMLKESVYEIGFCSSSYI